MKRAFVAGVLANAALLVGSLAVVSYATSGPPEDAPSSTRPPGTASTAIETAPQTENRAPAPAAAPAAGQESPLVVAVQPVVPPPASRPSRSAPKRQIDQRMSTEVRHARLSFRDQMRLAMSELQFEVSRCAVDGASFSLEVESVEGGIRILEAKPQGAAANGGGLNCATSKLRGRLIPAPSVEPGRRWEMPFIVRSS